METGDTQLLHNSANQKLKIFCNELKQKVNLNKNILLVNLPQFSLERFEREVAKNKGYYSYPPTGLQYLVSALKNRDLEIDILDLNYEFLKKVISDDSFNSFDWIDILKEKIKKKNYPIIGISNFFYVDAPYLFEISKFLRNNHECIIILGGQNATYNAEDFLKKNYGDFVCKRESENKINFLLDNIYDSEQRYKPTPGILFKYNDKIEETCGEEDIVELKGNLIDAHKIIPIEYYCKAGSLSPYSRMAGVDTPFAGILLNRGCRGNCEFCDVRDYTGRKNRTREIKDFLDELEYLNKERGIIFFEFLDDDFTRSKDKAIEAMNGIIKRGIKIKWGSNNGLIASTLDEELMEKIRDSGCIGFKIGVESGNPEILLKIRKPGTIDTFRKFSKIAQGFPEIFIVDNYILGFPNEAFKQILNSFNFSIEMNLDWSSFALYQQNESSLNQIKEKNERKDFIPAKDFEKGQIITDKNILECIDIFKIPSETIVSKDQLNHIWFSFNLIRNFIENKNLKYSGNPEKFISWTSAIEERYPTHPYINFFLALANNLTGNKTEAENQYKKTIKNMESGYWMQRLKSFGIIEILENFPITIEETKKSLDFLRKKWKNQME
ncbi:B12-binding domain-containing radical SAM protein [Candidatus Pacearchaeota archaeon]|nr:B12-binding domain-containing radical SAM protein [Candidatus Pacearchaeota archaeon]